MNLVARKKVIFVIVEGPSDDVALGAILTNIYNVNKVHVEILHCDITTEPGVDPTNILKKVAGVVRQYAKDNHFTSKDFARVIHLVDTDGAFIPDESIIEDSSIEKFFYTTVCIRAKDAQKVVERNKQKRGNLLKISRTPKLLNIPYDVYYMSCNLEHVLFNKLNCTDEEKEALAYRFTKKYKNDIPGFLTLISGSDFSVCDDYLTSWEFITQKNNSLNRHTNLGLCFKNNCNE